MASRSQTLQEILSGEKVSLYLDDRRDQTYRVGLVETSPCTWACPAGVNVKTYVSLIAAGRFQEALQVVRQRNPLPAICGRICTHPCEVACNRNQIDDPLAICALKRFLTDYELLHPPDPPKPVPRTHDERVAIVGSGPAGLTAANDLVRTGYGVTVFEALPKAGGMLAAGVPTFRLPRDILEMEIDAIRSLGVEIQTGVRIAGERAIQGLFDEGYQAIFLAVGAHKPRKLGDPGEEAEGVMDCITFLRGINFGQSMIPGRRTVVLGGGHSALDSAQTALRLGSKAVKIVYRRSRNEMPAHPADIEDAEAEGVEIHFLAAPKSILVEDGRVSGIECIRTKLGTTDESGRRRPHPVEGSEFIVEADTIITAIGESPDLSFLPEDHGLDFSSRWNTFKVDEAILATNRPGIFAGGDVVTGPKTVIDAIAAGHVAARSIHRYLRRDPLSGTSVWKPPTEAEIKVDLQRRIQMPRKQLPQQSVAKRIHNFDEIDLGFSETAAMAEAQRCLRCGPCSECQVCVPECDKQVTLLAPDDDGGMLFRLLPALDAVKIDQKANTACLVSDGKKPLSLQIHPLVTHVEEQLCRGCGTCAEVCEYGAVELVRARDGTFVARVHEDLCKGCGTCAAQCPTSAMAPGYFTDQWVAARLNHISPDQTNIVVMTCSWSSAHSHTFNGRAERVEGVELTYLQTLCAGRIEPSIVLRAFAAGADGVFICSCGDEHCHYRFGSRTFHETFAKIQGLVQLLGINPQRLAFRPIPPGDRPGYKTLLKAFVQQVKSLAPASRTEEALVG